MKTQKLIFILFVCIVALSFFDCKKDKIPENLEPIKALFVNDGVWYVEKYIANGADSTNVTFPNISANKEIGRMQFKAKKAKDYPSPIVYGSSFESLFSYYEKSNLLKFFNGTSTCGQQANDVTCPANVFKLWCGGSCWVIKTLTDNKVEMTCEHDESGNREIAGSYTLILSK